MRKLKNNRYLYAARGSDDLKSGRRYPFVLCKLALMTNCDIIGKVTTELAKASTRPAAAKRGKHGEVKR